jgi:hypothetical protein
MALDQNIKVLLVVAAAIVGMIAVVAIGIGIYVHFTNPLPERLYAFVNSITILHNDFDENGVRDDILEQADGIAREQLMLTLNQIGDKLFTGMRTMRTYIDSFGVVYSPTAEMRTLKESLSEEGSLFLDAYSSLKNALDDKKSGNLESMSANLEKARITLEQAINLRSRNSAELERQKAELEALLPD